MSYRRLSFVGRNLRERSSFWRWLYYLCYKKLFEYKSDQKCQLGELPGDILEKIQLELRLSDRIRSSIVCKSWKSIFMSDVGTNEFPWLVLPQVSNCNNRKTLSFLSISEGRVVDLKLPKSVEGGWFFGSSKGWLIMIKEQGLDSQMFLLNPISGFLHQLPPLATIPSFQKYVGTKKWKLYGASLFFHQVVLSTSNILSDECVVAANFDYYDKLALCKPGDKTWSVFHDSDHELNGFAQLLFSCGKLYVLTQIKEEKDMIVSETLRFRDHSLQLMKIHDTNKKVRTDFEEEYTSHKVFLEAACWSFLLESTNNEVLLIHKVDDILIKLEDDDEDEDEEDDEDEDEGEDVDNVESENEDNYVEEGDNNDEGYDEDEDEDDDEVEDNIEGENEDENIESMYARTSHFRIFKVDSAVNGQNFSREQSLGDQILFLASHGSLSLSAAGHKMTSEKNCIYFSTKATYRDVIPTPHTSREVGVFHLNTGNIKRSFPSINFSTRSRTSWYIPSV